MIFLDANAFYWYYGRDKLGLPNSNNVNREKLCNYLNRVPMKSIPASVYVEIVTHFRDNAEYLKGILKFIFDNKLKVYNNIPDYIVSPSEIEYTSIMSNEFLINYAYCVLDKKIDIEVKFAYSFLEIMNLIYLEYRLKDTSQLSKKEKTSIMSYIGRELVHQSKEDIQSNLTAALKDGYALGKELQGLKNKYIELLNQECIITNMIIDACIAGKDGQSDMVKKITDSISISQASGLDGSNTMLHIVDTLKTNPQFLQSAKQKISDMFLKGKYTDSQCRYLKEVMFPAWMDRGQKLRKNDIFDMFCVGVLDYKDKVKPDNILIDNSSYLLSFDTTIKEFIGINNPNNLVLIKRYEK